MAGDTTHAATHQAQWAAITAGLGVSSEDVKLVYQRMRAGRTYEQACDDVFNTRPQPHRPSAAALAAWKPEVTKLVSKSALG